MSTAVHTRTEWVEIPKLGSVRLRALTPARPLPFTSAVLVLAHGAGNDMDTPLLVELQRLLAADGFACVTFNFLYHQHKRKAPDAMPVLEETYRCVVERVRSLFGPKQPLVLGGKSLGGRVASHLVAAGERASGLVFLGYPLHPAGRPQQVRTGHWSRIRVPMLFIQGTRDPLCQLDLLRAALVSWEEESGCAAALEIIEGGDHSFVLPRSLGKSQATVYRDIAGRIARWFESVLRVPVG